MPHIKKLLSFIHKTYAIELDYDPAWESIAVAMDSSNLFFNSFIETFSDIYPSLLRKETRLAQLTEPLFRELLRHVDIQHAKSSGRRWLLEILFKSWTLNGTQDISKKSALCIYPQIKYIFELGGFGELDALGIVYQSAHVWSLFKQDLIELAKKQKSESVFNYTLESIIHRFLPERIDLYNPSNASDMYKFMCGAYLDPNKKTRLAEMRSILTGTHNNVLAWNTALTVCSNVTIDAHSIDMTATFSSLVLDPKDPEAWRFLELLYECGINATAAAENQKEMLQAHINIWSIIDALEEGHVRFTRASEMYTDIIANKPMLELALPTIS